MEIYRPAFWFATCREEVQKLAWAVNMCVNPDCAPINAKEILIVPQADELIAI